MNNVQKQNRDSSRAVNYHFPSIKHEHELKVAAQEGDTKPLITH